MPRPNYDRVRVSFHISRTGKAAVEAKAAELERSVSETYRLLLRLGLDHAPKAEKPSNEKQVRF